MRIWICSIIIFVVYIFSQLFVYAKEFVKNVKNRHNKSIMNKEKKTDISIRCILFIKKYR